MWLLMQLSKDKLPQDFKSMNTSGEIAFLNNFYELQRKMLEKRSKAEETLNLIRVNLNTNEELHKLLEEELDRPVMKMLSGPLGGDQQIGAMIAEGKIDVLIEWSLLWI